VRHISKNSRVQTSQAILTNQGSFNVVPPAPDVNQNLPLFSVPQGAEPTATSRENDPTQANVQSHDANTTLLERTLLGDNDAGI